MNTQFRQSKPVKVVKYKSSWETEFNYYASNLRKVVTNAVVRLDHIGSTAVPNLAAKDIIDIQVTVKDICNADHFIEKMKRGGYRMRGEVRHDELVGCDATLLPQLRKLYFREPNGKRRMHIHVRQQGYLNQQYPLIFRDYLRSNSIVRTSYETIKYRLSELFPEQMDGYLYIKDPLMDIIYSGAQQWAENTNWQADSSYL
jgi:GrpB-like predicted nucleotidyltransferase (UPF0157 family)